MLQFSIISTSEFLYLITNHATDAIKAVIHTVNMKFRKLKKNNVRNTKTTIGNLSKKCSNCPLACTQECRVGIENKRSFVDIKPVPAVEYVEILFIFAKIV